MPRAEPDFYGIVSDLRLAVFRLTRRLQSERAVPELSDSQLTVVGYLTRTSGSKTLGSIAEYQGVTPASMNRTVNILERAGYVRRLGDPNDRRRVLVEVTDRGIELVAATRARRDNWLESELSGLSEGDLLAVRRATKIMLEIAQH